MNSYTVGRARAELKRQCCVVLCETVRLFDGIWCSVCGQWWNILEWMWRVVCRRCLSWLPRTLSRSAVSHWLALLSASGQHYQGRNHVFKVGGPIPWSRVLLPFYRKKLDRSTQFGAVGYIITLYSSKSYVKSWGSVQISGVWTPRRLPQWLRL